MVLLDKEIEKMRRKEEKKVIDLLVSYMQTYREHIRITDFEAAVLNFFIFDQHRMFFH